MEVVVDSWAWLPKRDLTFSQLHMLKKNLTVVPRKMVQQAEESKPVYLFNETATHLGIPREYFNDNRKPTHKVVMNTTLGNAARAAPMGRFTGILRAEQQMAIDTVHAALLGGRMGGILRAAPGFGKTVCATALMAVLDVPTIVLVHKEFLMNQWLERIAMFLPDAKVGRAQQDECDYEGKSIVLGMIQSVGSGRYPQAFYDHFGLVIPDECHHIGAQTFSQAPPRFRARYRVGLSATPRRKDGCENVFLYQLGPVLFTSKEQRLKFKVKRVWTKFKLIKTDKFNPSLMPRTLVVTFLCASEFRNRLIVEQLIQAVQSGRKVIVLSERLKHLQKLNQYLEEMWPDGSKIPEVGFYVGGKKEDELETARTAPIVFATVQFASEGLDIPELDTLFLTTPISDVEQAVGRILRPHQDKKEPIVVDFRDDAVPILEKQGKKRDDYYERCS